MKAMDKPTKTSSNDLALHLCVYAVMPFMDCYCQKITGSSIPKIAKFCMTGNSDCPVFEKIVAKKVRQAA